MVMAMMVCFHLGYFPRVIWNSEAPSGLEGSFFNNAFLCCSDKGTDFMIQGYQDIIWSSNFRQKPKYALCLFFVFRELKPRS